MLQTQRNNGKIHFVKSKIVSNITPIAKTNSKTHVNNSVGELRPSSQFRGSKFDIKLSIPLSLHPRHSA